MRFIFILLLALALVGCAATPTPKKVNIGDSQEAVRNRLGPPMERMNFRRTSTEAWTYRWKDGTLEMIANVVFGAGSGGLVQVMQERDPAFSSPAR